MRKKFTLQMEQANCELNFPIIFSCLTIEERQLFDENKSILFFKKGQNIFHEGNHPVGLFCLDAGKVKIEHNGDEGKMQIVRLAKVGDLIGYRALFCNEKYNANAVALEDARICFFPKEIFFYVLDKNNGLAQNMIKLLASDLRHAEDHITELAQKPVRERMAKALLFLKDTYGFEEDNATINISLTREEIADLVGTATETSIRLLSELKHDGIIEFVGRKIKIISLSKLYKAAHQFQLSFN